MSLLRVSGATLGPAAARPPTRVTRVFPQEAEAEGPELSDWERYAAEEYDILVAEEAAGDPWEDG